jgi:AraC-like DNA-binding protein
MTSDHGHLLALATSRIHRSDSLEALMQSFLTLAPAVVDADAFGFYLLDSRLTARAIYAVRADQGFLTEYEQLRMADPCFLHLLRHRSFVHTRAAVGRQDWMEHPLQHLMARWGLRYSIEAPLMAGGHLAGTLNIARRDRGYFESASLESARFLCEEVACAFERVERVHRLEQDLARAGTPAEDETAAPDRLQRPGAEPAWIKAAEDHIRAHCAEPLTNVRIAVACGVSPRTLLEGFRRFRGTSPKAMLRELRFQSVRDALRAAQPGNATVADIATSWGFYELGHFAVEYKRRYAETPSATLRCVTPPSAPAPLANLEIFELLDGAVRRAGPMRPVKQYALAEA